MDSYEGRDEEPLSLHKYLFLADSRVDHMDPSGHEEVSLGATMAAMSIAVTIVAIGTLAFGYFLDNYNVGLEGLAAQQSAQPMVAAALENLQGGNNIQLFQEFFGPPIAPQVQLVTNNFLNVANALNQTIQYTRDYAGILGNGYAYSYRFGPMHIWLGPMFFKAPMVGLDSKAGTIIHELTHIVDGTLDYGVYGLGPSMALEPDRAVQHADSYEYYAEESFLAH